MSSYPPGFSESPFDEPSIFDEVDEEADIAADAEAEADIASGRLVPHEDVAAWLDTWGTANFRPAPASWSR